VGDSQSAAAPIYGDPQILSQQNLIQYETPPEPLWN